MPHSPQVSFRHESRVLRLNGFQSYTDNNNIICYPFDLFFLESRDLKILKFIPFHVLVNGFVCFYNVLKKPYVVFYSYLFSVADYLLMYLNNAEICIYLSPQITQLNNVLTRNVLSNPFQSEFRPVISGYDYCLNK